MRPRFFEQGDINQLKEDLRKAIDKYGVQFSLEQLMERMQQEDEEERNRQQMLQQY